MESSSSGPGAKREEEKEADDAWSDLFALRRLYGLLQERTADKEVAPENCDKLDEKSRSLLRKLLDDATKHAVQSQTTQFLCDVPPPNASPSGIAPVPPRTTPHRDGLAPSEQQTPDDRWDTTIGAVSVPVKLGRDRSPDPHEHVPTEDAGAGLGKTEGCPSPSVNISSALFAKQGSVKDLIGKAALGPEIPVPNPHRYHDRLRSPGVHRTCANHSAVKDNRELKGSAEKRAVLPLPAKVTLRPSSVDEPNGVVGSSHKRVRTEPTRVSGTNAIAFSKPIRFGADDGCLAKTCSSHLPKPKVEIRRDDGAGTTNATKAVATSQLPTSTALVRALSAAKRKQVPDSTPTAQIKIPPKEHLRGDPHATRQSPFGRAQTARNRSPSPTVKEHSVPPRRNLTRAGRVSSVAHLSRPPRCSPARRHGRPTSPPQISRCSSSARRCSSSSSRTDSCSSSSIAESSISKSGPSHRVPSFTVAPRRRALPPSPKTLQRIPPSRQRSLNPSPTRQKSPTRTIAGAANKHATSITHAIVKSDRQKSVKREEKEEEEKKKYGRLRRFKDKLAIVFHHHHHHYHHNGVDGDGIQPPRDPRHRSLWKYLRATVHPGGRGGHTRREAEKHGERAAEAAPRDHHQHGYFHLLLEGLVRHLWHSREDKKAKAKRKRLTGEKKGNGLCGKKLHWWQRFRKRGGGVKLANRKKPRLRLGFRRNSRPRSHKKG